VELKKNWMALAACSSVSTLGSEGASYSDPRAVERNVVVFSWTTVEFTAFPDEVSSGVVNEA
jgi:hypothetical protein